MRDRVTEGGLERIVIPRGRPRRIFPPSSSGDVTIDISPRTTGNEVVPIFVERTRSTITSAITILILSHFFEWCGVKSNCELVRIWQKS